MGGSAGNYTIDLVEFPRSTTMPKLIPMHRYFCLVDYFYKCETQSHSKIAKYNVIITLIESDPVPRIGTQLHLEGKWSSFTRYTEYTGPL